MTPRIALMIAYLGCLSGGVAAGAAPGAEPLHPLLREASEALGRPLSASEQSRPVPEVARALAGEYLAAGRAPPKYLGLLGVAPREKAIFSMACFWHGEVQLGELDGVASSRTGWLDGEEVVEVTYDPEAVAFEDLLAQAARRNVARTVFAQTKAQHQAAEATPRTRAKTAQGKVSATPSDDKYYSRRAPWKFLPMPPAQASRVNARLARRGDPADLLSPRQAVLLAAIEARPRAGWPVARGREDFAAVWGEAEQVREASAP